MEFILVRIIINEGEFTMKRFFISIFLFIIGTMQTTTASELAVLPTMQTKSPAQDRVWVGTLQIIWNDLMDKLVFGEVRFPEGTPEIVNDLNKQEFSINDIDSKSYYKYLNKASEKTPKEIAKAIKKKFNESSDILTKFTYNKNDGGYFLYTMLYKNFEFPSAFDKLGTSDFRGVRAEFFGIDETSDKRLKGNVRVLFYNSPSDYAVCLKTKNREEVYLYKTNSNKPFNILYQELLKKEAEYIGNSSLTTKDEFKAPNLKFFKEKQYDELTNRRIKGTNLKISKVIQTVKFDFNNEGGQLKSEAAMSIEATSLPRDFHAQPRLFYFNDTFVMYLKEKNKQKPYFALRVHDIRNYQ